MRRILSLLILALTFSAEAYEYHWRQQQESVHLRFHGRFTLQAEGIRLEQEDARVVIEHRQSGSAHKLEVSPEGTRYWLNDELATFDQQALDWLAQNYYVWHELSGIDSYAQISNAPARSVNAWINILDALPDDYERHRASDSSAALVFLDHLLQLQSFEARELASIVSVMGRWLNSQNQAEKLSLIASLHQDSEFLTHALYRQAAALKPASLAVSNLSDMYAARQQQNPLALIQALEQINDTHYLQQGLIQFSALCELSPEHWRNCMRRIDEIYAPLPKLATLKSLSTLHIPESIQPEWIALGLRLQSDVETLKWLDFIKQRFALDNQNLSAYLRHIDTFENQQYASNALLQLLDMTFSDANWQQLVQRISVINDINERRRLIEQIAMIMPLSNQSLKQFSQHSSELLDSANHGHVLFALVQRDLTLSQKQWLAAHIRSNIDNLNTQDNLLFFLEQN